MSFNFSFSVLNLTVYVDFLCAGPEDIHASPMEELFLASPL